MSTRPRFGVLDLMIVIAGIAISLSLLRIDARGETFGNNREDETCLTRTYEGRLLENPETRWRSGFPLTMWYLLAGPTLVGPILVGLNRKYLTIRPLLSGKTLWVVLGLLIWFEVMLGYFLCFVTSIVMLYDFQWREHHPLLGDLSYRLYQAGSYLPGLLFFGIPVMTFVVFIATRRRGREGNKDWMDRTGLTLGWLWSCRDVLFVLAVILNPFGYQEPP